MKIFEIFRMSLVSLKTNKLRSSLTMLGIVVGIFSIISISTVISMLQASIEDGVSALGKNVFQIQKWPIVQMSRAERMKLVRNRKDITLQEFFRLKDVLVEAKGIGAEQWNGGKIFKYKNVETNPNVGFAGCTPEAFLNNDWVIDQGRSFNYRDVDRFEHVVVLGADVAKKLFASINPLGQEIKVGNHKLTVIGILVSKGQFFGQSQDNFAIIPLTTFQSFYGKRNKSINITIMSHDKASYQELVNRAEGFFRTIRKVKPGDANDFSIRTNQAILDQINNATAGVKIGAFVIAAIALLAAGIGIMNIMLVSVTERTKEIGIRKAIGAKRNNILLQFIMEAVMLSILGGLIGIVLGVGVGNFAGSLLKAKAVLPVDWILIGVTMCIIIGVTFGTYPAYKAANLDPIDALRYE